MELAQVENCLVHKQNRRRTSQTSLQDHHFRNPSSKVSYCNCYCGAPSPCSGKCSPRPNSTTRFRPAVGPGDDQDIASICSARPVISGYATIGYHRWILLVRIYHSYKACITVYPCIYPNQMGVPPLYPRISPTARSSVAENRQPPSCSLKLVAQLMTILVPSFIEGSKGTHGSCMALL